MFENIHDLSLVEAFDLVIYHGFTHNLVNIAASTFKTLCLYEIGNVGTFLLFTLLINGDEGKASLEPEIIIADVSEEDFPIGSSVDISYL